MVKNICICFITEFNQRMPVKAINEFYVNKGFDKNAVLGITFSPLEIQVFNPENLEEATEEDYKMMIDELEDCQTIEEYNIQYFVRLRNNGELDINEDKLKRLALEKIEEF